MQKCPSFSRFLEFRPRDGTAWTIVSVTKNFFIDTSIKPCNAASTLKAMAETSSNAVDDVSAQVAKATVSDSAPAYPVSEGARALLQLNSAVPSECGPANARPCGVAQPTLTRAASFISHSRAQKRRPRP